MTLSYAPTFSRETPPYLPPPAWLLQMVGGTSRSEYIECHGFTEAQIGPAWWSERGIGLEFSPSADGDLRLPRGDVFRMADLVDDDESLLSFLWHALAWGSGTSRRNNDRRIDAYRKEGALLRHAFDAARAGDPSASYSSLIRRGDAVIRHFGPPSSPSFCTSRARAHTPGA